MRTIILLAIANIFMTFAWYGHLKFKTAPLLAVIFISWGIAFFEYCFQVPANRIGHGQFTTIQLKVIQEVLTLAVFSIFVITYMREPLRWNHLVSFLLLVAAVYFVFGFGPAPGAPGALGATPPAPAETPPGETVQPADPAPPVAAELAPPAPPVATDPAAPH